MKAGHASCLDCDREFSAAAGEKLCPRCQAIEDAVYANDPTPVPDLPAWKYSRPAMHERLSVSGKVDE